MSQNTPNSSSFSPFQVHVVSSTQKSKSQDSPTSSILKTPTAIFVNSRSSSSKTRRLKFANGPVDLETLRQRREGSQDSASSAGSSIGGDVKHNGHIDADGNLVEVAISPVKRMKVSPESWTAFLAYKKYNDYSNETEKTDYTYSRLSKYRHKEIIPGFPIRPNLSRSPITRSTNASKSYNFSYASDSYIRNFILDKTGLRHRARQLNLDSEDETDFISTTNDEERIHVRLYRTITRSLVAIYTSILYYIALSTSTIKDYFSRYLFRRSSYTWSSTAFWIPWSTDGKYTAPVYLSDSSSSYYSWFRSALYRLYERITTVIYVSSHSSIEYIKVRYSESSRKGKFLWFLIPLLLLAGLWLLTTEDERWRDADYWGVVDESAKYVAEAASSTSEFLREKSSHFFGETLKSPVLYIFESSSSAFSSGVEYLKYFIFNSFDFVLSNVLYAFSLVTETLSQVWIVFQDFLISFFNVSSDGVKSAVIYIYEFFLNGFFILKDCGEMVLASLWGFLTVSSEYLKASILYLFTVPRREEGAGIRKASEIPQQELFEHHKAIAKLSEELRDFKILSGDLEALKKRIDDLEAEFRKEKEERLAGDELYVKQLEENHKKLQIFQVKVNHALRRCCSHHSSNLAIRNFLNSQSEDLKLWITENFLRKTDKDAVFDENKIAALITQHTNRTGEDLKALQDEFKRFVEENKKDLESLSLAAQTESKFLNDGNISVSFIRKLISDAIKLYDADKTGKVDFALESGGGQVRSIRCTETYIASTKSYILLGWTVYTSSSSPRDAINPGMTPGQCWAFVGSQGYLVLQLSHTIVVSGFTMEHISKKLVHTGHIESAPKNFSMWGLNDENDLEPYLFGEYAYQDNDETLQYFAVAHPTDKPYKFVELKIMSNHGNPDYTCLYRIRVHGKVYHG